MISIFDVIGPVMIGPSSSHTAGAARLGKMARAIFGEPITKAVMTLYGSFAKTYKGHGTDKALVGGLLGFDADDARLKDSFAEANKKKMDIFFLESSEDMGHPNVVKFDLYNGDDSHKTIVGRSLGGGLIMITEIDGFPVEVTGEDYAIMSLHNDQPGVVAGVSGLLGEENINISSMRVFRKRRHSDAVMMVSTDGPIDQATLQKIEAVPGIKRVMYFEPV